MRPTVAGAAGAATLAPYANDLALLLLRVALGATMFGVHGLDKLGEAATLADWASVRFPDPLGIGALPSLVLAAATEGVGSLLLVAGIATRASAAALAATMLVAFVGVHGGALGGEHSGELALTYLAGFGALALAGGGRFSLPVPRGPWGRVGTAGDAGAADTAAQARRAPGG